MPIFIAPDRTQYPPTLDDAQISPELETITGADLAITKLPLPITEQTLSTHIKTGTLFVQIKIGYDILSFDALHNFCARVQKSMIPKQQAILLMVGEYWQDENKLFRVRKRDKETGKVVPSKPYGNTSWHNWRRMLMSNLGRGITIFPEHLASIDLLPEWIEDYQAVLEKFENEGKREVYPKRVKPVFESDDILQPMLEVPPSDPRYILCAGFDDFGPKKAQSLMDYVARELPHLIIEITDNDGNITDYYASLFHLIKIITDMKNGKPAHNVPGIGIKTFKKWRAIFGMPENVNLSWNGKITENDYQTGWQHALETFKELLDKGHSGKDAFNACVKMVKDLVEF